ncbi:50S ribosome-binding protein YggL [Butyricimonas synergistica]|uniref:50S ribosome-binding protein YggL n=1 Tax=Butyricimonas synergistica TaxID=544644 RepID=UPI0022E4F74B|nr:50S ribosome-binding protein YggL [Butyricimonas synergistica]
MKKRLRKKLHKGEFKELGFSFDAKFKTDTDLKIVEEWLQELAVLLHERGLEMGGGWNSDVCVGFITRERGSVTPEERDVLKKWFGEHDQHLDNVNVGELKDAWYGW